MPSDSRLTIHVVAGVLYNDAGAVLLAQRPPGKPMNGRWEFPGGKLLDGESAERGLARELEEELGVVVERARPLIQLRHDYPELSVYLEIFHVDAFGGEPRALEGQPLAWVTVEDLPDWDLLEADRPIVAALRLPDRFLVTAAPDRDPGRYLATAEAALKRGIKFVQCRLPGGLHAESMVLARALRAVCARHGARFIWNGEAAEAEALAADGLHLNAMRLLEVEHRPAFGWVGASCHDEAEIARANRLGLDYVFIGSVQTTPSHPGGATIGWNGFSRLAELSNLPAYAIGGMTPADIERAQASGGHGIAAIRGLWEG